MDHKTLWLFPIFILLLAFVTFSNFSESRDSLGHVRDVSDSTRGRVTLLNAEEDVPGIKLAGGENPDVYSDGSCQALCRTSYCDSDRCTDSFDSCVEGCLQVESTFTP